MGPVLGLRGAASLAAVCEKAAYEGTAARGDAPQHFYIQNIACSKMETTA
jgi:hypothetical protein